MSRRGTQRHLTPPSGAGLDPADLHVVTGEEMRSIDQGTIERFGVPGERLMENAGVGITEVVLEHFRQHCRRGVVLIAGRGNNGGDAFVVARLLRRKRVRVSVYLSGRKKDVRGDAKTNLDRLRKAGVTVHELERTGLPGLAKAVEGAGLVVDGLLGTGICGEVRGEKAEIIRLMNGAPCPIVAIDVPSGLDVDRGAPLGPAVQATVTVTMALPKTGQLVHPGVEYCGELVVVDIGAAPDAVAEVRPRHRLLTRVCVPRALPPRRPDTHKGTDGHVLVVGGSRGKIGAASLAGRAALRAGAGLATVASASDERTGITFATPEVMTEALPGENGEPAFSDGVRPALLRILDGKSAIVLGPGLGTTPLTRDLTEWLIASAGVPMIIDADGLNCLAGQSGWLRRRKGPIVLTPHPGEMARLAGCSSADVQADRIGTARQFAEANDVVVVLKGARTLVASPDGIVAINPTGNPGMASGGMGDALAGIIGALLGRDLKPIEAARAAVFWHGFAADVVASRRGEAGLLATDVIEELAPSLRDLQEQLFFSPSSEDASPRSG